MAHKLISKVDAKAKGLPRYFTGQPCDRGHYAPRYTNSGKCIECHAERNKRRKRGKAGKTGTAAKTNAVTVATEPTSGGTIAEGRAAAWGGLARRVKALIEKADKAAEKAEQFYKSAGLTIKEIKEKFPGNWEAIVRDECGIGRSRAYELMSIADGTATLAMIRASTNERQKKMIHKASVITDSPQPPTSEPETIEGEAIETEVIEIDVTPPPAVTAKTEPGDVRDDVVDYVVIHLEGAVDRILGAERHPFDKLVAALSQSELTELATPENLEKAAAILMRLADAMRQKAAA